MEETHRRSRYYQGIQFTCHVFSTPKSRTSSDHKNSKLPLPGQLPDKPNHKARELQTPKSLHPDFIGHFGNKMVFGPAPIVSYT
jgi:hypothetical protein